MKNIFTLITLCAFSTLLLGQTARSNAENYTPEQEAAAERWLDNLYTMGFEIKGDSMHVNEEGRLILQNEDYQKLLYPEHYTWEHTVALMKKTALKPAFWYLINLYYKQPEHKNLVLQTIIPFDQLMEMDKIMVNIYYTYISFDPEVTEKKDGKSTFKRPDIAEAKLAVVKEIVEHILYYRQKRQEGVAQRDGQ